MTKPHMSYSKKTLLWILYDFANSFAFVSISFYFGLWLVNDKGFSDIWISLSAGLSTLVLLSSIPTLGAISDCRAYKTLFLKSFSVINLILLILIGIFTAKANSSIFLVIILYFLFLYFYQGSLAFYDSILKDVTDANNRRTVSGMGMAAGQIGNVAGMLLVLPFVNNSISVFGISGRPSTFLVGGILAFIFSLPVYFFLKDQKQSNISTNTSLRFFWHTLKEIKKVPHALNFLITYYLFSDALLTFQLFITLYLEKVGKLDDSSKTIVILIGLLSAICGSLLSNKINKLFKSPKNTISFFILLWAIFIGILALVTNKYSFMLLTFLNGISFGLLYSLSRVYFSNLIPDNKQTEFFALYSIFERLASILGPLIWSTTILLFTSFGEVIKYRFAMLSLAIIVLISFFVLYCEKSSEEVI